MENFENFESLEINDKVVKIINHINSSNLINVFTFNVLEGASMSVLEYIVSDGKGELNAILQDDRVAIINYNDVNYVSIDEHYVILSVKEAVVIFTDKSDLTNQDLNEMLKDMMA